MILTLTILLIFSLGSNLVLVLLNNQNNAKWMRMFSVQQGIPLASMEHESKEPKPVPVTPQVPPKRFSVPIPGAQMFRKAESSK